MNAKTVNGSNSKPDGDAYLKLVKAFPLRPVRDDETLTQAVAVVDSLVSRGDLADGEKDYLEVLIDLVEKYELDAHSQSQPSDAEMLRILIDDRKIRRSDLARATKIANSTISEILKGKRQLTRSQIGAVAKYFGVRPTLFSFSVETDD